MERELTWRELSDVVKAHETRHNYQELKRFCDRYYPRASRVVVNTRQEYDDESYYTALDLHNLTAFDSDKALEVPDDEVALLVLLAESPGLQASIEEAKPEEPLEWFSERYYDDASNLDLCPDYDMNLEVELLRPPPSPKVVYVKEGGDDAALTDG